MITADAVPPSSLAEKTSWADVGSTFGILEAVEQAAGVMKPGVARVTLNHRFLPDDRVTMSRDWGFQRTSDNDKGQTNSESSSPFKSSTENSTSLGMGHTQQLSRGGGVAR